MISKIQTEGTREKRKRHMDDRHFCFFFFFWVGVEFVVFILPCSLIYSHRYTVAKLAWPLDRALLVWRFSVAL